MKYFILLFLTLIILIQYVSINFFSYRGEVYLLQNINQNEKLSEIIIEENSEFKVKTYLASRINIFIKILTFKIKKTSAYRPNSRLPLLLTPTFFNCHQNEIAAINLSTRNIECKKIITLPTSGERTLNAKKLIHDQYAIELLNNIYSIQILCNLKPSFNCSTVQSQINNSRILFLNQYIECNKFTPHHFIASDEVLEIINLMPTFLLAKIHRCLKNVPTQNILFKHVDFLYQIRDSYNF